MTRGPVVVLAALAEEVGPLQATLAGAGVRVVRTGVGPALAEDAARQHLAGAALALSTGCCGGLVAGAARGLVVIPRRVLLQAGEGTREAPPPDPAWGDEARRVAERLGLHCTDRPLLTVAEALHTPASKALWHARCGAVAVDMETAAVAGVAAELGVPHLAVRLVLDGPDTPLSAAPIRDRQGRLRPLRVARAVLRPRELASRAALQLHLQRISRTAARLLAVLLHDAP